MTEIETLRDEAEAYLTDRGHDVPARELVVEAANQVAYDKCVAESTANEDGVDSFDGDENCGEFGECGGWDGESHRCGCGNRRVYWEMGYGASFKDMYVMATAY